MKQFIEVHYYLKDGKREEFYRTIMERGIIVVPRVNPDGCEISIHGANACGKYIKEITRMSKGDFLHFKIYFHFFYV